MDTKSATAALLVLLWGCSNSLGQKPLPRLSASAEVRVGPSTYVTDYSHPNGHFITHGDLDEFQIGKASPPSLLVKLPLAGGIKDARFTSDGSRLWVLTKRDNVILYRVETRRALGQRALTILAASPLKLGLTELGYGLFPLGRDQVGVSLMDGERLILLATNGKAINAVKSIDTGRKWLISIHKTPTDSWAMLLGTKAGEVSKLSLGTGRSQIVYKADSEISAAASTSIESCIVAVRDGRLIGVNGTKSEVIHRFTGASDRYWHVKARANEFGVCVWDREKLLVLDRTGKPEGVFTPTLGDVQSAFHLPAPSKALVGYAAFRGSIAIVQPTP